MEETGYQVLELEEIGEAVEYSKADSDQRSYRIHSKFFKAQLGSKIAEGIEEDHRLVWLARGDAIRLLLRQGQVWAVQRIAKE
jgi:hypothetical protein